MQKQVRDTRICDCTVDKSFFFVRELRKSRGSATLSATLCCHVSLHYFRIVAVDVDRMCKPAHVELSRPLGSNDVTLTVLVEGFLPLAE